jgi:uncharacterized delta-60 repeat protein
VGRVFVFLLSNLMIATDPMYAAGSLDAGFGIGGKVVTDVSGRYDEARAVALEPDGQIVAAGVAGTGSGRDFVLARYNADGALDRAFGDGGSVITDVSGGSDVAWAVATQSDGKIVVAGDGSHDFALVRYNADGTLDSHFGVGGKVTTDFGGDDLVNAVAVNGTERSSRQVWAMAVISRSLDTRPTARSTRRSEPTGGSSPISPAAATRPSR